MSYAHLCTGCEHLGSRHLKPLGGDVYRCRDCECEIPRGAEMVPMSQKEYERRKQAGMPTWEQP